MVPNRFRAPLPCAVALLGAALSAAAQPAPRTAADPLDPKAKVPQALYRSSFDAYRNFGDTKLLSWREANDTVTRIGGWRVYAREAQAPDTAPAATPAATPAAIPAAIPAAVPAAPPAAPASAPPASHSGHSGHKTP